MDFVNYFTIFIICFLQQIWILTSDVCSFKCHVLSRQSSFKGSLHLQVKAWKINQSQIWKKVIVFFPRFYLQVQGFREVQADMFWYLWVLLFKASKRLQVFKLFEIIILLLLEEKGPVPRKVGLIEVEEGWCPCNVQSLYPLHCLRKRMRVCSSAWSHNAFLHACTQTELY